MVVRDKRNVPLPAFVGTLATITGLLFVMAIAVVKTFERICTPQLVADRM